MADKVSDMRRTLIAAARKFRQNERAMERSREQLHAAIVAAVRSGETKSQVARDTGYTREYVTALVADVEKREAAAQASAE